MRTNLSTLALAVFVALVFVQSSHALSLYLYAPLNNTFSGNDKIWFSYAVSSNSSCLFKVSKPDGQLVYSNSQANTWNWGGIIELSNGYYMWQVNCTSGNESAQSEVRYLVANATMGNNENGIVYLEPLNNTSVNNLSVALTYMANFTSSQNPSICVLNVLKFQSGYYFQVVTSETTVKLQPFYYSKIFNYEDGASYRWLVNCSYYDGEKWVRQPGAYRYFSVYAPGQASVSASILYPPEGSTMNAADSFMTFSASSSNGNPLTCNTYVGDQLESTYAVRSGMQATVYFTTSEGTKAIYVGCRVTNDTSFTFSDPRTVNFQKINISLLSPQNGTSFTSQNVELKYSAASTLKQPVNCTTFVDGVQKDFYPNLAFGTIRNFISTYTAGSHTWRVTCIMPGASPPTGTSQTSTFTVQQLNPPAADVKVALVFPENFSMFKASYYFPTALNYIANSSVAGSAITCISNLTKMGTGSTIQYTHSGTTPFRLFTYVSVPNGLYKWAVACNLSDGSTGTSESRIVGYNLSSGSDTWRIQNNFPENNENLNGQTVRFNFSGNFTGATNGNVYCGLRDSGRIAKANFEFAPPPQFSGSYSGIYNYGTGYNWYVNCTYFDGNSWVLQQGPISMFTVIQSPTTEIMLLEPQNNFTTTSNNVNFKYRYLSSIPNPASCTLNVQKNYVWYAQFINSSVANNTTVMASLGNLPYSNYNWQVSCVTGSTFVVSEDRSFAVAQPSQQTYNLTVWFYEGGTARGSQNGLLPGQTAQINATSLQGYVFANWTINYGTCQIGNAYVSLTNVTMGSSNCEVTAYFRPVQQQTYNLTVQYSAGGTASGSRTGLLPGQQTRINATASSGYVFVAWVKSGSCTVTNLSSRDTYVAMGSTNCVLLATFKPATPSANYTLGLSVYPTASGTVTGYSGNIPYGAVMPISATASQGYKFISWSVLDNSNCVINDQKVAATYVKVKSNCIVRANFDKGYTLALSVSPANSGTVKGYGSGFDYGAKQLISAMPYANSTFSGWTITSGNCNISNPLSQVTNITVKSNCIVSANFVVSPSQPKKATYQFMGLSEPLRLLSSLIVSSKELGTFPSPTWAKIAILVAFALAITFAYYKLRKPKKHNKQG